MIIWRGMIALVSSKGQIGLIEMIMVMVAIVMLMIGGIYFYYTFMGKSLVKKGQSLDLQSSKVLLASVTSLPELQCSFRTLDSNCVDTLKLMSFKEIVQENRGYYVDKFGFKSIKIRKIYPEADEGECDFNKFNDEYPYNCDKWVFYDNKPKRIKDELIISMAVSLYYPSRDIYDVGVLSIKVYK